MALWSTETISLLASTNKHPGNDYRLFFVVCFIFIFITILSSWSFWGGARREESPDPSGSPGETGVTALRPDGWLSLACWLQSDTALVKIHISIDIALHMILTFRTQVARSPR